MHGNGYTPPAPLPNRIMPRQRATERFRASDGRVFRLSGAVLGQVLGLRFRARPLQHFSPTIVQ